MSTAVSAVQVSYKGVAIERPCRYCDATSYHFGGYCDGGPCVICGVTKREQGMLTHPRNADGTWTYDGEQHDWAPHHYEPAEISTTEYPAFEAIVEAASALGWPLHYTSDLYRDYQMLSGMPDDAHFVWIVRESGTHIVTPQFVGWGAMLGYFKNNEPGSRVFYWNGSTLVGVDWQQAADALDTGAREHA